MIAQLNDLANLGKQQLALLQRIADALEAAVPATSPNYTYGLEEYPAFDWGQIGATVRGRDEHGATAVLWHGRLYTRRSPQNKFAAAIWFSRAVGRGEDETTQYERLVSFKEIQEAEPLPSKVAGLVKQQARA